MSQPSGLPNRLYRARGDGTFEDATEHSGLAVLDDTAQSIFADVDNDGDQDLVFTTATRPLLFINDGKGKFAIVHDAFGFRQPLQGLLTSMSMADYDRDGFLDVYLCVYSYFFGAGEDKAGTPSPYYDARNGPPGVLFRNDGRGRFIDATEEAGLDAWNNRYHFAAAWADYDNDGWIDLLVANDFGTKNLYRNRGRRDGRGDVRGRRRGRRRPRPRRRDERDLSRLRQRRSPRHLHRQHVERRRPARDRRADLHDGRAGRDPEPLSPARHGATPSSGTRGNGRFEDKTLDARAEMGRWAWSSDALDFDNDGWEDIYVANGMLTRAHGAGADDLEGFFWRQVVARSPLTRVKNTPYDDAWRAINQLLIHDSIASRQRNVFLRNDGQGGFDDVSGAVGLDLDQDGRSFAVLDVDRDGDPDLAIMAARQAPQLRLFRNDVASKATALAIRLVGLDEQPGCDRRARDHRDRSPAPDKDRPGRLRVPVTAFEGAARSVWARVSGSRS